MQAVILAAGMGKRLKELTQNIAKCMVKVNGVALIERALRTLDKKQFSRIVIVVGFERTKLMDFVKSLHINTPVIFIENTIYDKTNNIYSLLLAKSQLIQEDTLLLESDIIFEEEVIDVLLNDSRETLVLVDKFASWMNGTCLELDEDDSIREFIPGKYLKFEEKEDYYKTVNIYKFSKEFSANIYIPFVEAYMKVVGVNEYYESVIKLIAMLENNDIRAKRLTGQVWYEIDDVQDLDIASTLFVEDTEQKYHAIASRYGGYWRYPTLLDFCYLVNPYFPTKKMIEEMKSNFVPLLSQYPSGMNVNATLASQNFAVKQEHIVVGNGAAELIKELVGMFTGSLGIITPTFEEYHHRFAGEVVAYTSSKEDFSYNVQNIMNFYEVHPVKQLILINPDNPSGNYIPKNDVIRLIKWCCQKEIKLVIDESFIDFAEDNENLSTTYIVEDILKLYHQLFVVKSISKSYGVPGIRLGVIASSNEDIIAKLKNNMAIWSINSFAEFFMQILTKYKTDYMDSLIKMKQARSDFIKKLNQYSFITAYPSQANYILCELHGCSSKEIVTEFLKANILVKDITDKINNGREYLRIAVRTQEENDKLLKFLSCINDSICER